MSVMDLLITLAAQCASSQFRCDNGQCISSSVHGQCDGRTGGCTDGSDERDAVSCIVVHSIWEVRVSGFPPEF